MLNLVLAAGLLLAPLQDPPEGPPPPDPELVEAALVDLEQAFKKGKAPERVAAIEKHAEVNDAEVVRWIGKGLEDKDDGVKAAAVEAFRWLPNEKALAALHDALLKDKELKKNDALYAALVKAIGQHGDPSSIDVLLDGATAAAPKEATIARIYSLGHIRDKRSVEELLDLMRKTGRLRGKNGGGGGQQPLSKQFAVALHVLTGESFGEDEKAWMDWWKEHGKKFEVAEEAQGLDPKIKAHFDKYWSKQPARGAERPKRGGDPGDEQRGAER